MWYVIQTLKGKEYDVSEEVKEYIAGDDEDVFVFESEKEYRIKGEWVKDRKPFFPGYIFVDMGESKAEDFDRRLRKRKRKLIGIDGVITHIKPEEQDYLMKLGGESHVINYSEGFRIDDYVMITSGPFKGYNGEIKKLDRHHRQARISMSLLGKALEVDIGLEIIQNKTFEELDPGNKIDRVKMARIVNNRKPQNKVSL